MSVSMFLCCKLNVARCFPFIWNAQDCHDALSSFLLSSLSLLVCFLARKTENNNILSFSPLFITCNHIYHRLAMCPIFLNFCLKSSAKLSGSVWNIFLVSVNVYIGCVYIFFNWMDDLIRKKSWVTNFACIDFCKKSVSVQLLHVSTLYKIAQVWDHQFWSHCKYNCISWQGFKYAGTKHGNICMCGHKVRVTGHTSVCHHTCAGNKEETCGGHRAVQLYTTGHLQLPSSS